MIAPCPSGGTLKLVRDRGGAVGVGRGVGHLEDAGNAAHHGGTRSAFQVFLVLHPGFAEMDLRVDHARQHMQAGCLESFVGRCGRQVADCGNPAIADADIG